MCGENYWKGISAFCLTFGLSVFAAGFLSVGEGVMQTCPTKFQSSTEQLMIEKPFVDTKNCVPLDSSLQYENLNAQELPKPETKKQEKTAQKENKKADKSAETKSQFYDPSKDTTEYKTLLHKEKCYESDGRK